MRAELSTALLTLTLALTLALALACGKSEQAQRRSQETVRPIPAPRSEAEVGSAGGSGSQIIIASSSQGRGKAGAGTAAAASGGGGVDLAAESRAQTRARCDRLVDHLMGLTRAQLPKGEARDKLDMQGDPLRDMCMNSGLSAGGYERCVLRAKTLSEALVCVPVGDERAAEAMARASAVAARKDLLEKAEREINKDGGVAPPTIELERPRHRR